MKNPAPYRYDIVGSFLRTKAIHEARSKFEAGEISAEELTKVEDAEITGLVKKEENVGLHAVTDGEYRRSFWHMDFLWGLTGTQKVKSEHFSVAFKGFQPKAETVKIVDKLDFPDDHPFLKHFAFLQSVASDLVQPKQCIPSPSMLHLICCVRSTDYQPIERYKDEQVLLDDLAAAYQKAVKAFYAAGCRYLQLDDTSWGEFCSAEKRKAYAERGIDVDEVGRKYVYVLNKILEAKPEDMVITMHICRGNFRSTWSSTGGYEPVAEILFGHCKRGRLLPRVRQRPCRRFRAAALHRQAEGRSGSGNLQGCQVGKQGRRYRAHPRGFQICAARAAGAQPAVRLRFHRGR